MTTHRHEDTSLALIKDLSKKVDDYHLIHTNQISEIKDLLHRELHDVKLEQANCRKNWSLMGKVISLGFGSISIAGIINWLFHGK